MARNLMLTLGLMLLLLDVAPCGGCGNQRPVERNPDKMEEAQADEATDEAPADAPAKAEEAGQGVE